MGPFDTEQEARAFAHTIVPPSGGFPILTEAENRQVLERACEEAGVELGAYDRRIIINWLAGWTDAYAGVVAAVIARAYEAGKREGMPHSAPALRLIADPGEHAHRGHDTLVRRYPELDDPAVFHDCFTCGVTWEEGKADG